jgi:hypothetical protein
LEEHGGQEQEDRGEAERERLPSRPERLLEVVLQERSVAHHHGQAEDDGADEQREQHDGHDQREEVVPPARGIEARRGPGQGVLHGGHDAERASLHVVLRETEIGVREVRVERDGVAQRRLRARVVARAQGGHSVRDSGESHRLQAADVALDAQPADLAHRGLGPLVVALALRLLVRGPQGVEAARGGRGLPGTDVDHLVARRRDEQDRKDGAGENGHRPAALVACTKAMRSS